MEALKDAYHFSHDANARHDERILELRAELGWHGYGLWWAVVEQLRDAGEYRLSNLKIGGLAMGLSLSIPEARAFLDTCLSLGLLATEDEGAYFYAPSLRRRMQPWDAKRAALIDAGRRGAARRWGGDKPADSHPMATPSATPIASPMAIREEKIREAIEREGAPTGASPAPPLVVEKPKRTRRVAAGAKVLMAESPLADFDAFAEAWRQQTAEHPTTYAGLDRADLLHYHRALADWSEAKGEAKVNWLATIRGAMRRDEGEGKLRMLTARPLVQRADVGRPEERTLIENAQEHGQLTPAAYARLKAQQDAANLPYGYAPATIR